jgi:Acyl-coenzyme A synthetases/AMP-(fatty) acid ligases
VGGYIVLCVDATTNLFFNYKPIDIYWGPVDLGWVTGHSYFIYGSLGKGAITFKLNGIPTYPYTS